MEDPIVSIVMGSDSDLPVMREAGKILSSFGIAFEYCVASAHRTPQRTAALAESAQGRGIKVIIAGAGKAAHLAGTIAAWTTLPVIGIPLDASLGGLDALLSTVQMPAGVPVGTMGIGKSGAKNAALFAIQILSLSNPDLMKSIKQYRVNMQKEIEDKDRNVKSEKIAD